MPLSHQLSHPAVAQLPGSCCLAPTPDGHLGPRPQMAIWGASVAIWGASDGYLLHGSDGHLGGALAVFWRTYRTRQLSVDKKPSIFNIPPVSFQHKSGDPSF